MEIRFKTSFKLTAEEVFKHFSNNTVFDLSAEGIKVKLVKAENGEALSKGSLIDVEISGIKSPLKFIVTSSKFPDRVVLHSREDSVYKGEWHIDFISTTTSCIVREKIIFFPKNVFSRLRLSLIKNKIVLALKNKSLEIKSRL